ncbi:MAG: type II toxin-antitoxin system VapC family toxin [Pseudolabrys sp.]|jgi:ribonuclease VapC
MVIDSSALIAILRHEPERDGFKRAIYRASIRLMSTVTKLEASMVASGTRGRAGLSELDALLGDLQVKIVPFDDHHAMIARDAFVRYGKGRHPAGLNFGDCASYALAMAEAEPLLFKGTDFGATDVEVVA